MSITKISKKLRELGLSEGDTVLVHSSLIGLDWKEYGDIEDFAEMVFDSLMNVLGDDGTLIVPTFTLSWSDNSPNGYWNLEESESETGLLTELVRTHPESTRTVHPIYSFSVIGNNAEKLGKIHDRDSYSRKNMFGKIHDMNAKILLLGVNYNNAMTFFHYVEQQVGVDYRYWKDFHGKLNIHGKEILATYQIYVRDLGRGIEIEVNPMGERLEEENVMSSMSMFGGRAKIGQAEEIYDLTREHILKDEKYLYDISE
jgi:aminoglycoside 3-N-acetyltransferase